MERAQGNPQLSFVPEGMSRREFIRGSAAIGAVLIAIPLYMHAPIAIAALQSGKNVFTEKMMAWSIEDAKKMARAAISSKRVLQIGHQRRANPMYNHAWELINSKKVCGQI